MRKVIWTIGNVLIGAFGFYVYLWGIFQAWGQDDGFWLYGVGSVAAVLAGFAVFNFIVISSEKTKRWGISVLILLACSGITMLIHGILQTILE